MNTPSPRTGVSRWWLALSIFLAIVLALAWATGASMYAQFRAQIAHLEQKLQQQPQIRQIAVLLDTQQQPALLVTHDADRARHAADRGIPVLIGADERTLAQQLRAFDDGALISTREAEALAWMEEFPLLVFPCLFQEKLEAARFRTQRQMWVEARTSGFRTTTE